MIIKNGILFIYYIILNIIVFNNAEMNPILYNNLVAQSFQHYMINYNKSYVSLTDEHPLKLKRFEAFKTNFGRIEEHNIKYENGESTFALGLNELADLTDEEYLNLLGYRSKKISTIFQKSMNNNNNNDLNNNNNNNIKNININDLPDAWDWREHDAVTPVKNQGMCGSCWAFSAVASMECAYARTMGKLVSFSEQELVDCVNSGNNTCTRGGEMKDGFEEIISHHHGKIDLEATYEYTASSKGICKANDNLGVGQFTSYVNITSQDENEMKKAVATQGVISVAIDASSFLFQLYHHGVFNWPLCKSSAEELDHGVAVVGYGTFRNNEFWLVKNSWGNTWGMHGYIMMSRNKNNQCGIATDGSYPIMKKEIEIIDSLAEIA